ncbi:MAG: peptidase M14 [Flavobacteriaceae bacterium]|nr:peptidase M14 [Flavobacteriaceae bacterium]|tara:strand:+ start:43165 stop:44295 length:1131 start_codon:yes stop_codon:yes gene_type:complete
MDIDTIYNSIFEARLAGRYIALRHLTPLLKDYQKLGMVSTLGTSENGNPIYAIRVGHGPKKVLAWSQMHGNESTTTKALFDFLNFLIHPNGQPQVQEILSKHSFLFIPLLNPDGAEAYTRENARGIDLNRDAVNQSQKESKVLRRAFEDFKPHVCLNLHGQRTFYSLPGKKPASLSFLAPAADADRTLTPSRKEAMLGIAKMNAFLQGHLPGQIGRYDDSFNDNCVGDSFQKAGVPTILFEAGHCPGDYQREQTRKFLFYAFLSLFGMETVGVNVQVEDYFKIPENEKNFRDVILRKVVIGGELMDIAIQYKEVLQDGVVVWEPYIDEFGDLQALFGHRELEFGGNQILINSNENVFVNEKIATIVDKSSEKIIKI